MAMYSGRVLGLLVQFVVLVVAVGVVGHSVEIGSSSGWSVWCVICMLIGDREARKDCISDMVC